jgi:hypothetical protein
MTLSDWIAIAVPLVTIGLAAFATYAGPLGVYLAQRTHNEQLGRVVAACGRIAAEISENLAALPAGANTDSIRKALIQGGVSELNSEFAGSIKAVGGTDPKLTTMITREMLKLPTKVTASVLGQAVTAAVTVDASTDAAPVAADPPPAEAPAKAAPVPVPAAVVPLAPAAVPAA